MLREKLNNNFLLNDFTHIDVMKHDNDNFNDFRIYYKEVIIKLSCNKYGIMASAEGFITMIRAEYLLDFIKALEKELSK